MASVLGVRGIVKQKQNKTKQKKNMDNTMFQEIMDYKAHCTFPEGLTKHQRYSIKRRASTYVLKGKI